MSAALPPEDILDLGLLVKEFAFPQHRFIVNVLAAVPIFLAGAAFVALWVLLKVAFPQPLPLPAVVLFNVALLGFGSWLILAAVVVPVRIYKHQGMRVLAFEEGMAYQIGDGVEVLRWNEIVKIRQCVVRDLRRALFFGEFHLILGLQDGSQVEFDDIVVPRVRRLTAVIQQQTLKHLLNAAFRAWEAGEEVSFGSISVTRKGIVSSRRTLPWGKVNKSHAARGRLTIWAKGRWRPWLRTPVTRLENPFALVLLVNLQVARHKAVIFFEDGCVPI